jgi:hypothetical protein
MAQDRRSQPEPSSDPSALARRPGDEMCVEPLIDSQERRTKHDHGSRTKQNARELATLGVLDREAPE